MNDPSPSPTVAVVTGAARGIGLAVATRLAERGHAVALIDRDEPAVQEAAKSVEGGTAVALDITDSSAVDAAIDAIEADIGPIGILVNNAGVLRDRPLLDMTDDDYKFVLEVCLVGSFYMCRSVARHMIPRETGRIINISSRGYLGNPGQANYASAKSGLIGLTKALAKELGRYSITVNAVAPGMIETDLVKSHPKADAIIERAVRMNSVPRIGQPEEIAEAVAYFSSPLAGYITGDVMHVTGGRFG